MQILGSKITQELTNQLTLDMLRAERSIYCTVHSGNSDLHITFSII